MTPLLFVDTLVKTMGNPYHDPTTGRFVSGHPSGSGPVPPRSLAQALAHVRAGGTLTVTTQLRRIEINRKTLERFEKAGHWLLKEEGDGYRLRQGKHSVYLLPGQLTFHQ